MKKLLSFSLFALLLMLPLITNAQDMQVNLNSYSFAEESITYEEFLDGTATGVSGDDAAANFDLPFAFLYAGVEFTQVRICTNGWVSLGTNTWTTYSNDLSSTSYLKFLALCWDDLNMDASVGDITYRTEGEAPNRVFAIQYRYSKRLGGTDDNLNYQLRIHETTGVISFTYGTMSTTYTGWTASVGITGLTGGANDFISVTPGEPSTASSTVANNAIDATGITSLSNKKYTFTPADFVTLLEPLNNANNISVTPLFSWEALEGYVSYALQVSTTPDFTFLVISESGIENTIYQVDTPLDESTVYYWRVNATDIEGTESNWSGVRTFVTEGNIPPISLVSPANGATGVIILPTFTWIQNLAASFYEIEIATDAEFNSIVASGLDIAPSNWTLPVEYALGNNSQYYWRVRGYADGNIGEWSEVWSFTTLTMVNVYSYITVEQDNALYEEFTDGTPTISGDDNGANYPLPFTFVYAGAEFTQIRVCTNGWVGIGGDITHNALGNNLASTSYFRLLAACWDDLNVIAGTGDISYRTEGVEPNRAFAVQFRNVCRLGSSGESLNFQIRLYESTGEISFTYGTMNASYSSWSASVGITGLAGGLMDFISATPGSPTSFSSDVANNSINAAGVTLLTTKKYTFLPMGDYVMLTSPLNNSITETDVTLDWEDFDGAATYQLQVATSADFATTIVDEDALTVSTYDLSELEPLTRYFWRARALVNDEYTYWSSVWTFLTTGELPAPVLVAPENGVIGVDPALRLRWERNIVATGYTLQVATDIDFTELILDETGITNNFYNLGGLSMSTQYYWRVQMYNPFNTSDWSDAWTFTTGNFVVVGIGENYDTDYYNYVSPSPYSNWYHHARLYFLYTAEELLAGGAVPNSYITNFGWNIAVNQPGVGPLNPGEYSIRMKLTTWTQLTSAWDYEDWSTVWEPTEPWIAQLGWNMHQCIDPFFWDGVSSILVETCFSHWNTIGYPNPQQYWTTTEVARCQQRSVYEPSGPELDYCTIENNIGWGGPKMNRANIKFTLAQSVLSTPSLVSPENGSFGQSLTPLFTWNPVEGATSYTIQVSPTYGFEVPIINEEGITETEFQVPAGAELDEMTTYYWRVIATNGEDNSFWSTKWNFITLGDLPLPVLVSPENASTDLAPSTELTWEPYFAATGYNVQVALDEAFENIVINVPNLTGTSYITAGLSMSTQYYWRVQMFNTSNESEWCLPWSFTTGNYVVVGTGTSYDTDYYNYVSPSPYSNWYNHARLYFLYTAEELLAAGAIPNTYITNFGWNIAMLQGNNGALNPGEFAIRMKPTTWTQLNGTWDYEDWTTVWEPETPFTAALGWNMHECLVPFFWDGVSSILVETCFSHYDRIGNPNPQQYWTNTPVARCQQRSYYPNDGIENDYCTVEENIGWGGPKMNRANIRFQIEELAIIPPQLISPFDGQFPVSTTPTFEWSVPEGAVTYSLQVSTSPLFEVLAIDQTELTEPTYEVPEADELDELTTYYWRANATTAENETSFWSQVRSFITLGELTPPALITPVNYASDIPSTIPFDWTDVITTQNYQIQIATDAGFENIVVNQLTPVSELNIGLDMTTSYWWRVRAINEFFTSDWSEIWSFTTGSFFIIGLGEDFNNNTTYPAPYGNWYWGAKHQILLRAEEITAAGGMPGDLTSLSFNVAAINTTAALTNFEIKMKQTTENDMTATWDETDLTQVFFSASLTNVLGWNTHMFSAPFNWDGVSNILIDICFNNASYTNNQSTYYTPTTFNSVRYVRNDNAIVCSAPAGATLSANRPNIMFSGGPSEPLPPAPELIFPENASVNQPLTPILEWNFVEEAANYRVQLADNTGFNNCIVDVVLPDTYYEVISELNYETQYWWRVRSITEMGTAGQWSSMWSFTTAQEVLVPWEFDITDNFSTIMVPGTVNPMIGDRPMMEGDAIGLFYERTPGEWYCAGYTLWTPAGIGITVYGDDTQTAIKDGYAIAEPYTFRVWDGLELQEYSAYATYLLGPEVYEMSGFSMLATLVTNLSVSQDIQLNTGWNMISGYVVPTNPAVESLFEDFESNLKIMKNSSGDMYAPAFNINTIGNWNNAAGYLVNMLENEVLTLTGEQIVPETTPLNLNSGWNLSAYYRDNPMSPFTALASINPYVVLVKNNVGGIYNPIYGINTIGNMEPGQGYYFYMNEAAPLTYPANGAGKAIAGDDVTPLAKHLIPQVNNTGNNATLLLSVNIENGNEIGVYNANNVLIGSGAVNNGVAAITIWGDNDITANLDGAAANELLSVKLYNSNTNSLNEISLMNIQEITNGLEQDALYYNSNAIYLAKAIAQNETALVMSITNIPNPVSSSTKFEFSLVNDDNAEILVYNVRGEEIARLANGFYNAGTYSVSFDASNLTSGAYNVVLRSGNQTASTIMMITK